MAGAGESKMIVTDIDILKSKCEEVSSSEEAFSIISLLEKELSNSNRLGKFGVGLAAPQIGILKKVAIVRFLDTTINLVNSKIEKYYDKIIFNKEGCLSFPNIYKTTSRYNEIYIVDNLVYPNSFIVTGTIAVICQHEIDHFNGMTLHDREII